MRARVHISVVVSTSLIAAIVCRARFTCFCLSNTLLEIEKGRTELREALRKDIREEKYPTFDAQPCLRCLFQHHNVGDLIKNKQEYRVRSIYIYVMRAHKRNLLVNVRLRTVQMENF